MNQRAVSILLTVLLLLLPTASTAAQPAAAASADKYYTISGTNFVAESSADAWSYGGYGCLAATSGVYHASVNLPDGAVVTAITVGYYNLTTLGTGVFTSLLRIYTSTSGFSSNSYSATSGTTVGFNTATAAVPSLAIDNGTYAYTLSWGSNPNQQLCYVRLTYTPPPLYAVALPAVMR